LPQNVNSCIKQFLLYYAASLCFGVTYNRYHLLYIALLACTLFGLFSAVRKIEIGKLDYGPGKGVRVFLALAGAALVVA